LILFIPFPTFTSKERKKHHITMSGKPVFVFVPGAWHVAATFDVVRDLMHKRGFETEAIATPSVGASPPTKGLHADIEYTKAALKKLVDAGRQVVVVNHSYGGLVGAGAVEGLGYAQRSKAGLSGGVIMSVWMAAFATPKGQSALDMLGGNWLPWMQIRVRSCISNSFISAGVKSEELTTLA
jgi:alpha-beta hydrolase superfamily lysophospholipase